MTTELTIGAIDPGYGGLPIGVAAALGGATLAWHAHPGQAADCPGRTAMRYHHPHAGAHTVIDAPPPMVDVLTINRYATWQTTGAPLIDEGYKPPLVIVEAQLPNDEAVPICEYLDSHGYPRLLIDTKTPDPVTGRGSCVSSPRTCSGTYQGSHQASAKPKPNDGHTTTQVTR